MPKVGVRLDNPVKDGRCQLALHRVTDNFCFSPIKYSNQEENIKILLTLKHF